MIEVADVLRRFADDYLSAHGASMLPSHRRAITDILACRTEALGGHLWRCDACSHEVYSYHSCKNRSCPKCHTDQTERWLEARKLEMLPCREEGILLSLPSVTSFQTGPIAAPTGVAVSELIRRGPAGSWMQVVVVGWNTHPDARVVKFEVQYQFDGTTDWIDYGSSLGVIVEITDELGNGAFNFRVCAVAFDGSTSPWVTSSQGSIWFARPASWILERGATGL